MDAMILAAGLGTRLRPLTNDLPKALVPVGGVPVLERVARRLIEAGADRLVVNVHHHADKIRDFLRQREEAFGVEVLVSEEPERPLETGGGLLHAAALLRRDAPFFMHNADVLTGIDLGALYAAHRTSGALATLAVRPLETPRYLAFDADGALVGYGNQAEAYEHLARPVLHPERLRRVDFCGVQVIDPRLPDLITETGVFSIIRVYLRLAAGGERIAAFDIGDARWIDIGSHEKLAEAQRLFP